MKRFGSKRPLGDVNRASERLCDARDTARRLRDRSVEDALRLGRRVV
jgi:hypothetical protein